VDRRRCRRAACIALVALSACAISRQDEMRLGEMWADELDLRLDRVRDAELNRYLTVLGDSVARLADTRGLAWRFVLVDSREVNAFALPGGHVYVTRGLVERATEMHELAGVLAHEIAHVTRRHTARHFENARRANAGLALACALTAACDRQLARAGIAVTAAMVAAHYSRDDEREADAEAIRYVVRAGIHPEGFLAMLETLQAERQRKPGALARWFATHPSEEDRIDRTRRLIARLDPALLATLTRDTPRYRAFHARLTPRVALVSSTSDPYSRR
jgi:predicted Zn-dependent protease